MRAKKRSPRKSKADFSIPLDSKSAGKFYTSIAELPVLNWWEINEKDDLTFLAKDKKDTGLLSKRKLNALWRSIYNQFIERFGFSEHFLDLLEKEVQIAKLIVRKNQTGNMTLQTIIEITEIELENMSKVKDGRKVGFFQLKGMVEKRMGFQINPKTTVVEEFYSYIEIIKKEK